MTQLSAFVPHLDDRLCAEFLAHTLVLLQGETRQDSAILDASALRLTRPEPPRDPDLPLLLPKVYPRLHPAQVEMAIRALVPPPPVEDFTGRKTELDRVVAALTGNHPVVVTGESNTGKTALLRQVAHDPRISSHFRRVWWLDDLEDAGITLGLALQAPGVLITDPAEQSRRARDFMLEANALLLVDSTASIPDGITWALACTPHIVVVTDRAPRLPGVLNLVLAGLPPETAAEWLARLSGKPLAAVQALAALVDNRPGAIRLLATLLVEDNAAPETLTALLSEAPDDPGERMAALYAASFEALPDQYRVLCRALAAFPGRWFAVEKVLQRYDKPLAAQRALTFIERRGFVERRENGLRLVSGWAMAIRTAGVEGLAEGMPDLEPLPRPVDRFDLAQTEDEQLSAAAALQTQGLAWMEMGSDDEAKKTLDESLALRIASGVKFAVAEGLVALGRLAYLRGDDVTAVQHLESAAQHLHDLRDESALEVVRLALSRVYRRTGRLDAALSVLGDDAPPEDLAAVYRVREEWAEAIAIYERWISRAPENAAARLGLVETFILAGRYAEALDSLTHEAITDTFVGQWLRATIYHLQGDLQRALTIYRQLYLDTPPEWRATLVRAMARVLALTGEVREAALLAGAEGTWYEAKLPRPIFARQRRSLALYAHLCLMLGQDEEAESAARNAHTLTGELADPEAESMVSRVLGRLAWKNGELETAIHAFETELAVRGSLAHRDDHEIGVTLHNLADVQREQGKHERAIANYRRTLTHKDPQRDRRSVALTEMALFDLLLQMGRQAEVLEVGQRVVELLLRPPAADLRLLGYVMARQIKALYDFGRAPRGDALLGEWLGQLAGRAGEAIDHPYWGVQALVIGLYLRSELPIEDPVAMIDLGERALTTTETEAPGMWPALAARRDLGQVYLRLEYWDDAYEILVSLLETASDTPLVMLAAQLGLARAAAHQGRIDEAVQHFDAACTLEPDQQTRGLIAREAGEVCREAGQDSQAADYYAAALALLRREGDLSIYIETLITLAYTRLRLRRFSDALDTFEDALKVLEQSPDPALMALTLLDMATAHYTLGQYRRAAETYRRSLTYQDTLRDPRRYAETSIGLARSEVYIEEYQKAVEAYYDALQFDILSADERRVLLSEQAAALVDLGQEQSALTAYESALAIEGASPVEQAEIHRGLGLIYNKQGRHEKARQHFEAVLSVVQDDRTGLTLKALGDGYRAQNQLKEAIDVYHRALESLDRAQAPLERAATERALGEIYLERNQFANALVHLEAALDIERALPQQNGGHIVSILQSLARTHELRSELEKAALRHHEALVYQDVRHAPERYVETLRTLGRLYTELRRHGEAVKSYEEALRAETQQRTPDADKLDAITVSLAGARRAQGQLENAADLYRRVSEGPRETVIRNQAAQALREVSAEINRYLQMLAAADQSLTLLKRVPEPDLKGLVFIRALQAQTCVGLGRREECEQHMAEMFRLLVDQRAALDGAEPVMQALGLLVQGWKHEAAKDQAAAHDAYQEALEVVKRDKKANQALTWAIQRKIEETERKHSNNVK